MCLVTNRPRVSVRLSLPSSVKREEGGGGRIQQKHERGMGHGYGHLDADLALRKVLGSFAAKIYCRSVITHF